MNSLCLQEAPADQTAAELQKGFMNVRPALESDSQPAKLMQPRDGSFHDPAGYAQSAAVFGATPSDLSANTLLCQSLAMRVGIVGSISLHQVRFALGRSDLACHRRNVLDQGQQLGDIMVIGGCENGSQRNTLRIREEVVFATRTTAIGWVRSSFFPRATPGGTRCRRGRV